ncbi:MAG: ATP synthase subunit I [Proteobacteria bacterium]|nr:ATP synthase subunit I [Pseudomonadota bacterium]
MKGFPGACYNFAAKQAGTLVPAGRSLTRVIQVSSSVAAGRQLAQRVVIHQIAVSLLLALICLLSGPKASAGALMGGMSMVLGGLAAAAVMFTGGVPGGAGWLMRLLLGTGLKWCVVVVGLYLAIAIWKLPAPAVLAGAAMAAAAFLLAARQWNRGRKA